MQKYHQDFSLLKYTRKATGLKPLRVTCWEIDQVVPKCKMDFLDKTCKKRSKTEK